MDVRFLDLLRIQTGKREGWDVAGRLLDHLSDLRHRLFVGRTAELELLQTALLADVRPFNILYVYGPSGIGKTALLHEFARLCRQLDVAARWLDARAIEPTPAAFTKALRRAAGLPPDGPLGDALATPGGRVVVFLDAYELLQPLEPWLRDEFLSDAPGDLLLIIASRQPPAPHWQTDADWHTLMRVLPLRNLTLQEAQEYLIRRGVPPDEHPAVLSFTHGHPLALSLVADLFDQRPGFHFEPDSAFDVVRVLLQQFLQQAPGPAHRAALEACALVRSLNEALLGAMLDLPRTDELFTWLRSLSFIEPAPGGLCPHELARDILVADMRWRNPDWYAELHRRARGYYIARLRQPTGPAQQQTLLDYIYLHRYSPAVRPFFEWRTGSLRADSMHPADRPALIAMVEAHEGPESARLAEYWLARQPHGVVVLRDASGEPVAFLAKVALHELTPGEVEHDPAVTAACRYLEAHAPLRPGEAATFFRFWLARDTYQSVSAAQSLLFVNMVRHYLMTSHLAFTFIPCADPDFWAPVLGYVDFQRLPEADFSIGGRDYGVYGHDWRVMPPLAWLTVLDEREISGDAHAMPSQPPTPILVLSQQDFSEAVQHALRDFMNVIRLRSNPLVQSRLVLERAGLQSEAHERVAALRCLIEEAVAKLGQIPRLQRWQQVLETAYLHPVEPQEQAAERLGLPFSTYRRYLKAGVAWIAEHLWLQELGETAS